jgi:4-hydroxy-2-oxoheptanedioate aldolase
MRSNRLRQLLDAGKPTLGTHLLSTWPTLVELVGQSGMFDYVELTAEYAPFDLYALDNFGRALELAGLAGMMKLDQEPRIFLSVRALGSGFQSLLFADVRTVEDAVACVRAVRAEAPHARGLHGVGMRRDVGVVREPGSPAFVEALDQAVVAIMVEKRECVEDLDAILSVPGLDMVQFGPADYAMSIGLAGNWSHPDVVRAERLTIETALKKGLHPRVEIHEPAHAAPYVEMGVKHFCIGWDVTILSQWYRERGAGLREVLQIEAGDDEGVAEGGYLSRS